VFASTPTSAPPVLSHRHIGLAECSSRSMPGNPTALVGNLASEEAWSSYIDRRYASIRLSWFSRCGCQCELVVATNRSGW